MMIWQKIFFLFQRDCSDPQNSWNDKNQNCTLRFDKKTVSVEFCQPSNPSGGQTHGWILLKKTFYYKNQRIIKELGRMTCEKTMEKRSSSFIMQSISMEVQRSNVACITATVDSPKLLNELFKLFHTKDD